MGHIGFQEILVIVLILLVLFGAKKLPEIGRAIGRAIKEFKKAGQEVQKGMDEDQDSNSSS